MNQYILIVDDEANIVRLVKENLEKNGFKNFDFCLNGRDALLKIRQKKPDLIILDIMMPIMSGLDLMKELQVDRQTREIPVIFLTAKGTDSDVFIGYQSGATMYLTKPFDPGKLTLLVKRILSPETQDDKTYVL